MAKKNKDYLDVNADKDGITVPAFDYEPPYSYGNGAVDRETSKPLNLVTVGNTHIDKDRYDVTASFIIDAFNKYATDLGISPGSIIIGNPYHGSIAGSDSLHIQYKDPDSGQMVTWRVPPEWFTNNKYYAGAPADELVKSAFGHNSKLYSAAKTMVEYETNAQKNADADYDLAETILSRLGDVGYANTNKTLSAEDRAAITAALPDTDNLLALNAGNKANIFPTLLENLKENNPEVLQRLTLEQLEEIADTVSDEQRNVTHRGIKNQQAELLKAIAQDPELYSNITKQMRADNAAGTIAGQRAANIQGVASEADAKYDEQAAELYKSLFSGENGNVAQQDYAGTYSGKVSASDRAIQSVIDRATQNATNEATEVQKLLTLLEAVGTATGVDVAKFADEIAERHSAAGGKATSIVEKAKGDVDTQLRASEGNLEAIYELASDASAYYNQAKDGSVDVSPVIKGFNDYISSLNLSSGGGYTNVEAGPYQAAEKFKNKQYDDVVTSEFLDQILSDSTIDSYTKAKTVEQLLQDADLKKLTGLDNITLAGLTGLYEGYNTEATEQANQIFNKAQRAYIAAITAGDAKTAEQLTRLATTAGASKGNLYAASALANQFKQQVNSNSGRQLATDFLNQQSFNKMNAAQQAANADAALGKYYYGNGASDYDQNTIYGAYNQHTQNVADAYKGYGQLGNIIMGHTQDLNSHSVKNAIDNYDRLVQVSAGLTAANATAAAGNAGIKSDIDSLTGAAQGKKQMAEIVNPILGLLK